MRSKDETNPPNVMLSNEEALNELLVAALTLALQTDAVEAAEHILDALRTLHGDDHGPNGGVVDAGFQ